jgi:hypothetical protein
MANLRELRREFDSIKPTVKHEHQTVPMHYFTEAEKQLIDAAYHILKRVQKGDDPVDLATLTDSDRKTLLDAEESITNAENKFGRGNF